MRQAMRGHLMKIKTIGKVLPLALAGIVASLSAQDFRATLSGQVTDPSHSAIPGATVKATNLNNNEVKEATTNSGGYYTLPYLDPAEYGVEVTASGFQSLKIPTETLRGADKLSMPFQLSGGQISQEV